MIRVTFERARAWVGDHKRLADFAFFMGGVLWDATTRLQDASLLRTHLQLAAWLLIASVGVVIETRLGREAAPTPGWAKIAAWTTYGVQFALGSLLGAFTMHYFFAASWGPTLLFLLVIAALSVANEFLAEHLTPIWLRIAMLAFCTYTWLLFAIPVLASRGTLPDAGILAWLAPLAPWMNPFPSLWLDLFAAIGAFGLCALVGFVCDRPLPPEMRRERLPRFAASVGGVLTLLAVLDALGLVPPVPLSVVETAIVSRVDRVDADYVISYPRPRWTPWRRDASTLYLGPTDEGASCFTPIFAPPGMTIDIVHVWEHWSDDEGRWVERMRRAMQRPVHGGRQAGYRTWSTAHQTLKDSAGSWLEGWWRCRVETGTAREIARRTFWLTATDTPPQTVSRVVE